MSNTTENATKYKYWKNERPLHSHKCDLSHINLPNGVTNVYDGIDNIIAVFKFDPTSFTVFANSYDREVSFIGDPLDQDLPLLFKYGETKIRQKIKIEQTYRIYRGTSNDFATVSKNMTTNTWNIYYHPDTGIEVGFYVCTIIIDKINELRQTQFDAMLK